MNSDISLNSLNNLNLINSIILKAKTNFLTTYEIKIYLEYCILNNLYYENSNDIILSQLYKPISGSLIILNKYKFINWRKDGYSWKLKDDKKTYIEYHCKLKHNSVDTLNCCYSCEASNSKNTELLNRRTYWLLNNPTYILIHYLSIQINNDSISSRKSKKLKLKDFDQTNNNMSEFYINDDLKLTDNIINTKTDNFTFIDITVSESKVLIVYSPANYFNNSNIFMNLFNNSICNGLSIAPGVVRFETIYEYNDFAVLSDGKSFSPPFQLKLNHKDMYNNSREHVIRNEILNRKDPELQLQIINCLQKISPGNNSIFSFSLFDLQQTVCNGPNDDLMEVLLFAAFERAEVNNLLTKEWAIQCDSKGRQLIHFISGVGYVHLLNSLIKLNVGINCQDLKGRTPLHYCAINGNAEMACALFSYGADETILDNDGISALILANEFGNSAIINLFIDIQHPDEEDINDSIINPSETILIPDKVERVDKILSQMTLEEMGLTIPDIDNPTLTEDDFAESVEKIQIQLKTWLYKRQTAAKKIQQATREWLARKNTKKLNDSAIVIQSMFRTKLTQKKFQLLRQSTIKLQKKFRKRHSIGILNVEKDHNTFPDLRNITPSPFDEMNSMQVDLINKDVHCDNKNNNLQLYNELTPSPNFFNHSPYLKLNSPTNLIKPTFE